MQLVRRAPPVPVGSGSDAAGRGPRLPANVVRRPRRRDERDGAGRGVARTRLTAPCLPVDGATRDLGTLGGPDEHSGALAINNRGDIVGWSFVPTGEHPVLWRRTPASPSPAVVTSGP